MEKGLEESRAGLWGLGGYVQNAGYVQSLALDAAMAA